MRGGAEGQLSIQASKVSSGRQAVDDGIRV